MLARLIGLEKTAELSHWNCPRGREEVVAGRLQGEMTAGTDRMFVCTACGYREDAAPTGLMVDGFDIAPHQWGLRGDPPVWVAMRDALADAPIPSDVSTLLHETFEQVTGISLSDERESIHVPHLERGGMSSGVVHLPWWHEVALPLILARVARSTPSDESQEPTQDLSLGPILAAFGITELEDLLLLRHTYTDDGLVQHAVTPEAMLAYARSQSIKTVVLPKNPPRLWLNFLADGGSRARFWGAMTNHGESIDERTETLRHYHLTHSDELSAMKDRLVIDWGKDPVRWAKRGPVAAALRVLEIADPEAVAFPGYDELVMIQAEMRLMVDDPRYSAWRTALGAVQGIYLITDRSTGRHYIGKADGGERILQRWAQYARDGHGGNKGLRALAKADPDYARHFQWSLLRVFGPSTPTSEVHKAEAHYKRALMTREFGYNHN